MVGATRAAKSGIVGAAVLRFNCSYDAFQCDRCVHGFDPLNKLGGPDHSGPPSLAMCRLVFASAMFAVDGDQGITQLNPRSVHGFDIDPQRLGLRLRLGLGFPH